MNVPQRIVNVGLIVLLTAAADRGQAATFDHLECFKAKDAELNLEAFVDLDNEELGLAPDCKVGKAKFYCAPAAKTVDSARNKKTGQTIDPLPFTGKEADYQICYKAKCAYEVPDREVTDQFGTRTVTKLKKILMVCAPAPKAAAEKGWLGKVELATCITNHQGAQYWIDSDGVKPEAVGCHYAYRDANNAAPYCDVPLPAGTFGEMCVTNNPTPFDAHHLQPLPTGPILIETNPAKDECHVHKKGVGHPDVYDCDLWCKGKGQVGGTCQQVLNHCGNEPSAWCACNPGLPTPTATPAVTTPTLTPTPTPTLTP